MKERNIGLQKIADIAHMSPDDVREDEVLVLYHQNKRPSLLQRRRFGNIVRKYLPEVKLGSRHYAEQRARFAAYVEAWLDLPSTHLNYASFIPSYVPLLEAQKRFMRDTHTTPRNYKTLLLGSLSKLTTEAFRATTRRVFPKSSSFIVDLRGEETRTDGFSFADGLNLPFADASLHSVQTNSLLHMLRGPKDTSHEEDVLRLCQEAYRVLAPGGALFMVEADEELNPLIFSLGIAGFSEALSAPCFVFDSSKTTLEFMEGLDGHKNPSWSRDFDLIEREYGSLVVAHKE